MTASVSSGDIRRIGDMVFRNECSGKEELLVNWNEGEDFLSLGIGHFIWYPATDVKDFIESFPLFLRYAKDSGAEIPGWLGRNLSRPCPWNTRDEFLRSQDDPRLIELRRFLISTKLVQARFIVKRLDDALPIMLKNVPEEDRGGISARFGRLSLSRSGAFAMVDYINFKGLGISPSERYNGKGWGLTQVLLNMKEDNAANDTLKEFVNAAKRTLEERVNNAPPGRNEKKWLAGWQNRVESYLYNIKAGR
ncbi:MAG: hypothetical protein WC592_03250 [Candidatus Omnitrophota bacterium]|nr:hypothetical protein [Candidatus Omnitrophota bacterium]